ncbi:MAG: redoxin domain-containing protein [Opitutus sp.]|nr:redoxin domain-containing protein [Opitutus sp.]
MKTTASVAVALLFSAAVLAQPAPPAAERRAAAKAAFDQARELFSADIKASVAGIRRAIDLDPDYAEAHQYFILYSSVAASRAPGTEEEKKAAGEKSAKEMEALYQQWAKDHPDRGIYQYALGQIYDYKDPERSVRCYEQAVKLNPKLGNAWDMLAISAEEKGELARSRELHRKAVDAEPDNISLWRHLVGAWHEENIDHAVELGMEMAQRFPDGAASIISYLATRARTIEKSRAILELLHDKFAKASVGSLPALFSIYLSTDRPRALALAQEMVKLSPENKVWPVLVAYAQAVIESDGLIAQGKSAEVLAALDQIVLPRYGVDRRTLDLTRAKALDGGAQTARAYDGLLVRSIKSPNDEVQAALRSYGKKLGKTVAQIDGEVLARRAADARPGVPFSLVNYATGQPVALDDFKGRVVLVNFWYPKCGPCRGEFPFLQSVLEKYQGRGFEILAINGHPPEDEWVMPLIKGWKLGFMPLKGTEEVVKAYKVRGFPSNFLYGPNGRIYYEPPPVNSLTAERELELQIEALLATAKS